MELTQFEQKALLGKYGAGLGLAARIIVNLGEFFEAPHTIKIGSAQISGVSVKTGGRALENVLDVFIESGDRTRVPAFLNPGGFDLERYRAMNIPDDFYERQNSIISRFTRLGVIPSLTCTPYLNGLLPRKGESIAWAESSAVSFANSCIGARTNRESGLSALASSMLGRTPYYGLHIPEGRVPTHVVEIEEGLEITGDHLYVLGLIVGSEMPDSIPYIRGIRPVNVEQYKGLGAAMAATGNVSLYHVEGETPEWKWAKKRRMKVMMKGKDEGDLPVLRVGRDMLDERLGEARPTAMPQLMVVGCPHAGIEELVRIDRLFEGPVRNTRFWVFTSYQTRTLASRMGLLKRLEDRGVEVFSDTCMVVSPLETMGFDTVATNSGKALHYLPRTGSVSAAFMPLEDMVRAAQEGCV